MADSFLAMMNEEVVGAVRVMGFYFIAIGLVVVFDWVLRKFTNW